MTAASQPPRPGAIADQSAGGHDLDRQSFADALGLFVGRGRRFSAEAVSAATAIPLSTIKSYQGGLASPSCPTLLTLMRFLPIEFAGQVLGKIGLGVYPLDPGAVDPHRVLAVAAGGVSSLATALADQRIDHTEEMPVALEARRVAAQLTALAEQLEAAHAARRKGGGR
jgi:hypothetical protein